MSYVDVGSPGNVPVYHSTKLKVVDKRVRVAELVLRCVICVLGVLTAVLVGTDSQVKQIFSIQKKARFTDMKALVFLVLANGIAAAYSLLQVLRCVVSMVRGHVLFNKPLAWAIFSGDQILGNFVTAGCITCVYIPVCMLAILQIESASRLFLVMAYVTVAAVAAAAQSSVIAKLGQPDLQWMQICNMYGKFCNQVGEGLASALFVSLSMVVISCMSAFGLFRLYGGNKGKSSASW